MPKLHIDLIPKTSWFSNLRQVLTASEWKAVKTKTFEKAGSRCEICGGFGPKHPVECHEVFTYSEDSYSPPTQTLVRTIALCPACHRSTHFGMACVLGLEQTARSHLKRVNQWDDANLENHIERSFELWSSRNQVEWAVDLSWVRSFIDLPASRSLEVSGGSPPKT